jgi:hypothetical protein
MKFDQVYRLKITITCCKFTSKIKKKLQNEVYEYVTPCYKLLTLYKHVTTPYYLQVRRINAIWNLHVSYISYKPQFCKWILQLQVIN